MMDDSDFYVQCPYNKSHMVQYSRMQTHLVKCKRSHEHPQLNVEPLIMRVCRYNSNHRVRAVELDKHHLECAEAAVVQRYVTRGKKSAVPYTPIDLPPADENWDDEEYNSTYNPEQHASSSVIIRHLQGVPKSERKGFRMRERERINILRENQQALEKSAKANPQPKPAEVNTAFSESRLRQPKSAILGMGRGRLQQGGPLQNGQGHQELQDIPTMLSKAAGSVASSPRPSVSNAVTSPTPGSSDVAIGARSNSRSDSSVDLGSDDGFIVQKGKKNKKRAQPPSVNGHVPSGSGQDRNPLMSNGGSLKHALPGQPGRGRGRLGKN